MKKCNNIKDDKKCMRPVEKGGEKCKFHKILNEDCPICLENDSDAQEWLLLSCTHRAHKECLKGMNKLECPICRGKIINLPADVKVAIENNREDYEVEIQAEEEQQFREMMQNEIQQDPPPQLAIMLALRYVHQLGIPVHIIPQSISLEIDPGSPLPPAVYIFNQAVLQMMKCIQTTYLKNEDDIQETDSPLEIIYNEIGDDIDDDQPFDFEGEGIVHRIRTVPMRNTQPPNGAQRRSMVRREIFNTMNLNVENLPPLTEEDLEQLFHFEEE
ncbi:MAG TPA: RING-H2 finger protein [Saprospiraceae bacterium]|nr:RING-H2 finger protein [Saprospiraceae bacterium]